MLSPKGSTVFNMKLLYIQRSLRDIRGQGTLEFALVTAAFLVVVCALALVWRTFDVGLFVEHALMSASHHLRSAGAGVLSDVFLY